MTLDAGTKLGLGEYSRRDFLRQTSVLALAWSTSSTGAQATARPLTNPIGYATISWPQSQFLQALETISSLGFVGLQMLGWVKDVYADKAGELKERLARLSLQPAVLSCSELKL